MSPRQVVLIVLLVFADIVLSQSTCNPDNRECSCADTSSRDCEDFLATEQFHVEDGIEECMEICKALNPLGKCEWLLYHYSPAKEDKLYLPPYLNCELFATDDGSLDQYVNTCDKHGQPTRRHDGSCTVSATNPATGECNTSICPSGCSPCDETDECHRKYHETECSMLSPVMEVHPNIPDFDFCVAMCAQTEGSTYATWSHLDHICKCYSSGERLCRRQAVKFGFSQDDINQCVAEPSSEQGILVIGGGEDVAQFSVEFWSPSNPEEGSCVLNDYPREMWGQNTANFVSGKLVSCYKASCDIYNNGMWTELVKTRVSRLMSSSVQTEDQILLIGGFQTQSTEWIPLDGSPSQPGPFEVRNRELHCTIQVSPDTLVVTGGRITVTTAENYVTEYQLTGDGAERELNGMITQRYAHACGHYLDADGQQVLLVTGGYGAQRFSSTEVAVYSSGSQLQWREIETGQLPEPNDSMQATLLNDIIYISGGCCFPFKSYILSWDPSTETWKDEGDLTVPRAAHAAVAVPSSIINCP